MSNCGRGDSQGLQLFDDPVQAVSIQVEPENYLDNFGLLFMDNQCVSSKAADGFGQYEVDLAFAAGFQHLPEIVSCLHVFAAGDIRKDPCVFPEWALTNNTGTPRVLP